jgi:hypothetical protein
MYLYKMQIVLSGLRYIMEKPYSNFVWDIDCPDVYRLFPPALQANRDRS